MQIQLLTLHQAYLQQNLVPAGWNKKHFSLLWWAKAWPPSQLHCCPCMGSAPSPLCPPGHLCRQNKKMREGFKPEVNISGLQPAAKESGEMTQTTAIAITSEAWGFCLTLRGLKSLNYRDGPGLAEASRRVGRHSSSVPRWCSEMSQKGEKKKKKIQHLSLLIDLHPLKEKLIISAELWKT